MIALLGQAPAPPGGGSLAAYVALAGTVVAIVTSALNAWSNRRTNRQRQADIAKQHAETGVISEGTPLEWRTTDHQALLDERAHSKELAAAVKATEQEARETKAEAAQLRIDRDNDRELIADLRRDLNALRGSYESLLERIGRCKAGTFCPVADSLTAPDTGPLT